MKIWDNNFFFISPDAVSCPKPWTLNPRPLSLDPNLQTLDPKPSTEWVEIWRMQLELGEKLLFAGEKKLNGPLRVKVWINLIFQANQWRQQHNRIRDVLSKLAMA